MEKEIKTHWTSLQKAEVTEPDKWKNSKAKKKDREMEDKNISTGRSSGTSQNNQPN